MDLMSVERSYENIQRSIASLARPVFVPETERFAAQMAALVSDNERAMGGVTAWMHQLDRDVLKTTYQVGAKMAEIERVAQQAYAATSRLMNSITASAAEAAERAAESVAGIDRAWRQNLIISARTLEQLPAVRAAAIAIQLPEFDTTFLGSLHKRLEQLHESGAEIEPAMAEIDSAIKERAGHLSQSWVNFKGMFDLLYPLLLVLFQLWYAKLSEERSSTEMQRFIESQLRATETHLALQIQILRPPESREAIRVVERQCYLRADRFAKAMIVGVLYPNQIVEVRKTSGKWAYVEFFDYVNAIPKTGWILKKYVTTIDLTRGQVQRPPTNPLR